MNPVTHPDVFLAVEKSLEGSSFLSGVIYSIGRYKVGIRKWAERDTKFDGSTPAIGADVNKIK